jgi:hypothetical protein
MSIWHAWITIRGNFCHFILIVTFSVLTKSTDSRWEPQFFRGILEVIDGDAIANRRPKHVKIYDGLLRSRFEITFRLQTLTLLVLHTD